MTRKLIIILMRSYKYKTLLKRLKEKNILVSSVSDYPFSNNILSNLVRIAIPSGKDFKILKSFFHSYKD